MAKIASLAPYDLRAEHGWARLVTLDDGRAFRVRVDRGRRVKVAFKPSSFVGFKWYGRVFEVASASEVWSGEVGKSYGARAILALAGLVERGESPKAAQSRVRLARWQAQLAEQHAAGAHAAKSDPYCAECREGAGLRPIEKQNVNREEP